MHTGSPFWFLQLRIDKDDDHDDHDGDNFDENCGNCDDDNDNENHLLHNVVVVVLQFAHDVPSRRADDWKFTFELEKAFL